MDSVRAFFLFVFENLLYPGVVLLVMVFLVLSGISVALRDRSGRGFMARIASALLPPLVLVLLVAMKKPFVSDGLLWLRSAYGFAIGAAISVAVMELRHRLPRTGMLPMVYLMASFSIASAIIYFFLADAFGIIEPAIAGFAIAGCVHTMLRRPVARKGDMDE